MPDKPSHIKAVLAITDKKRITDPTVIPKGTERTSTKPEAVLNKLARSLEIDTRPNDPLSASLAYIGNKRGRNG